MGSASGIMELSNAVSCELWASAGSIDKLNGKLHEVSILYIVHRAMQNQF